MSQKPTPEAALATISEASRLLAQATDFVQVQDIRDRAAAIKHYLKECRAGQEAQNQAAELKIRCERKLGEMIPSVISRGKVKRDEEQHRVVLSEIGLSTTESSRLQRIASIPDGELEAYIVTTNEEGLELTTAGVLRLWRALQPESEPDPFVPHEERSAIRQWLEDRRFKWPEIYRPAFINCVKGIIEEIEKDISENNRRGGIDPADQDAGAA